MTRAMPKKRTLSIVGRRWFQKTFGYTYYTAIAYLDGEVAALMPPSYGYGDQYKHDTIDQLIRDQSIPPFKMYENGLTAESLREYTERAGIEITSDCVDVSRKKDLHSWR